jgi:hypothetical protein
VYKQDNDAELEIKTNCAMLERVIGAVESLSPNFCFLAWPSGTLVKGSNFTHFFFSLILYQGYGIYKPGGGPFKAPYKVVSLRHRQTFQQS